MTRYDKRGCKKVKADWLVTDVRKCPLAKKKVLTPYYTFVSSPVFATVIDAPHLLVVDSGSSDHIAWDRDRFVESRHVPVWRKKLFI